MNENFMTDFNFPQLIENNTAISTPCPDQIFGYFENGKYTAKDIRFRENIEYVAHNKRQGFPPKSPIVIVLESPHKAEFDGNTALGIAHGTTGRLFNNNFDTLISNSRVLSIDFEYHDVVLLNAVQYQCSLGKPLNTQKSKLVRDENWIKAFNAGCSDDLVDRIGALKPYAVINLCTKGLKNLQMILDEKIRNFPNYTYGTHPSTWNFSYAYIK